ncbi:MAG: S8 family serine peptidase [Pseudomonadota bacterium]
MNKGLITTTVCLLSGFAAVPAAATEYADEVRTNTNERLLHLKRQSDTSQFIVLLDDESLMDRWRSQQGMEGEVLGRVPSRPGGRPDLRSDNARAAMREMDERFNAFELTFEREFGRALEPVHRYRAAANGFTASLSSAEVRRLSAMEGVKLIAPDENIPLNTFAGPEWIGADRVWAGEGFASENRGEGIVIGVIDSGVNWEHPSFDDFGDGLPFEDPNAYDHENPYEGFLGLCAEANPVPQCNDKLVGVYDFVTDNPNTDVVEEFNDGADNGTHGAHTAGTAAGNPVSVSFLGGSSQALAGVAPNANVISYRVCFAGDPDDPDDDACQGSAILRAIDQAIMDGVDVINYSIGGGAFDPWVTPSSLAYLEAHEAGIFVATSGGNEGPFPGTIGQPANAPWITAVGSATHDEFFGNRLTPTSGGATAPPASLVGRTLTSDSLTDVPIVYAGDFGNALCGVGASEQAPGDSCEDLSGVSNPFAPGTFNGEIVVCDDGGYGILEKGNNLRLAGASGYVLVNVEDGPQTTVEAFHCLPATHLNTERGNELKEWLAGGNGHRASLNGTSVLADPAEGDRMSDFSSRGPNLGSVEDILKPNLIAPGDLIFAAGTEGSTIIGLGGTSMASPHVAGAAALMLAERPGMTPSQIASVLELTATDEFATDENFGDATHFDTGAGRPQLLNAVTAGLYLDETSANFAAADPFIGGDPKTLNLATMTDLSCQRTCSFTRRIGAFVSGRTWTVSTSGFPAGLEVTVTPDSFTLAENEEQTLTASFDWSDAPELGGTPVYGKIHIDNASFPRSTMPVTLFLDAGTIPEEYSITASQASGAEVFPLPAFNDVQQLGLKTGGLIAPQTEVLQIPQDQTRLDPYDSAQGTVTLLFDIPPDTLLFHVDTPASVSDDVDLFIGFDQDGDGQAEFSEEVDFSASFTEVESIDVLRPAAGTWWVLVQNWDDGASGTAGAQDIPLVSAVVTTDPASSLTATGPGILETFTQNEIRLSWDDLEGTEGTFYGAVGFGDSATGPSNLGAAPVIVTLDSVGAPQPTALLDGGERRVAIAALSDHDGLFIDVPPGTGSLEVQVSGGSEQENNFLELELFRVPFDGAFAQAPGAIITNNATSVGSDSGGGGQGPSVSLDGGITEGRYFAVVTNDGLTSVSVSVSTALEQTGASIDVLGGLWEPASRPGINQGFEYTPAGGNRAFLWYTYEVDGSAAWYIASAPASAGNRWQADLFRFVNDGSNQFGTKVGEVAITMLSENDAVLTWNLFGTTGSDRVTPLSRTCPEGGSESFTGLWFRGMDGLGGASIIANVGSQAHIHYLYDGAGIPRWLLGAGPVGDGQLPLSQFTGFPPNGSGNVTSAMVGSVDVSYVDNATGNWTLDYSFQDPGRGELQRTDDIIKLSNELSCAAPQ